MAKKSIFRRLVHCVLFLVLIGVALLYWGPWKTGSAPDVPTADVKLGEFVDYVQVRGEVRTRTSTFITAPSITGDLQILRLWKDGTMVKKGDIVVEFDPSVLKLNLNQYQATLRQADAAIARINAQQLQKDEQTITDKMMAEFDLERARLDASKGNLVPAIENEKNLMALDKAEMKLREVDRQIESNKVGAQADLAAQIRKRDKANADLDQLQKNMASLTLTSPVDGLLMLQPNSRSRAAGTSTVPIFKEGDRTYNGAIIAEIPDLSTIQVKVPIEEGDRGKVDRDQAVSMRVDAMPDRELKGHVSAISTIARSDTSSYPYRKNFDATVLMDEMDPRLRPGMSATVRIAVLHLPNSTLIPVEAIFEKHGSFVAYVLANRQFEERGIEIGRRGDAQAIVTSGLRPGEHVALKDPTLEQEAKK